ncbi:MAG: glycosyltransferase [Paraglaciecola sp.]|uniref:glycosyltransferase n=1 Tax=Paraglaciecola sp. TaxID=1920173 RepID=UPI00329684B8
MKILHVISSLNLEGGGPAQGVRNLTSYYAEFGASATVLSMDEPGENLGNISHLNNVICIGAGKGVFSYHPHLIDKIKEIANEFDAVVVHGLWQYHGYATFKALQNLTVPYYVFPHGMLDPYFKKEYPLKHLKKYLFWLLAQHSVLKHAKAVLFTCEEEKLLAKQSFWPYSVTSVVVNYGTTLTDISTQATAEDFFTNYPELRGKEILLFLSRIHQKKGCDLLIQALSEVVNLNPNIHLVMAGPDQTGWKKDLITLAQTLKVDDKITWTGMLKDKLKWGAIKAADVFVLPSHQENFGISVAEALALGTPVLVSNKVNIWREIVAMNAGIVENDTLEGTTKLLTKWIGYKEEDKTLFKQQSLACFKEKFDIKQASKNLLQQIKSDIQHD